MSMEDDAGGFGCPAFGHLASAHVDRELQPAEMESFATHLPGCLPCQRLVAQYRALDAAAMPAYPRPAAAEWDAAWTRIRAAVEDDRARAASSPVQPLRDWARRRARTPWALPLAAAAAVAAIVMLATALGPGRVDPPAGVAQRRPAGTAPAALPVTQVASALPSVTCQAGWEAVVFTIDDDEPTTVVQCQPLET